MLKELAARIQSLANHANRRFVVALDGRSGTGKSTLAHGVSKLLPNCLVIQQDDFFSGGTNEEWATRTPEGKFSMCIDWKRLRREALEPLLRGERASWRPFDFKRGKGLSNQSISAFPAQIIILDGVYSCRPELQNLIDLSVLLESPDDERRARLIRREGEKNMRSWHRVWDDAEDYYFQYVVPKITLDIKLLSLDKDFKVVWDNSS